MTYMIDHILSSSELFIMSQSCVSLKEARSLTFRQLQILTPYPNLPCLTPRTYHRLWSRSNLKYYLEPMI